MWERALAAARKPKKGWGWKRFPASVDLDEHCSSWFPEGPDDRLSDRVAAFQRFVEYEVFASVGGTSGSTRRTYEIRLDPNACLIKPIPERREICLNRVELHVVREFLAGRAACPQRQGLGLTDADDGTGTGPRCIHGFEKVDLPVPQKSVQKPASKPGPVRPAPSMPERKAPSPWDSLTQERDELRSKLRQAQELVSFCSERLSAVDAKLKLLDDERRSALLRKRDDIDRQLAALDKT